MIVNAKRRASNPLLTVSSSVSAVLPALRDCSWRALDTPKRPVGPSGVMPDPVLILSK